jgi:hypothetical protein
MECMPRTAYAELEGGLTRGHGLEGKYDLRDMLAVGEEAKGIGYSQVLSLWLFD